MRIYRQDQQFKSSIFNHFLNPTLEAKFHKDYFNFLQATPLKTKSYQQSDQILCTNLVRLGGTVSELLEIDEMRDIILSTMRTIYSLIER